MKFLKMPNKPQTLKLASSKMNVQNKENIDPSHEENISIKPKLPLIAMDVEEIKDNKIYQKQQQIYEKQILQFLIHSVRKAPEHYNYFSKQPDITEHMRMVLFNWLIDVHLKYKLNPQTLFITINIIDTFLSSSIVYRTQLQLVGITALWIASKYQQTYQVPKLSNLVYICDSTYTDQQILQMQSKIHLVLNFDFLKISSLSYYQSLKRFTYMKQKDYFLGRYLLEILLFDVSSRKYTELTLAASVIFFIQKLRGYELSKQQKISEISKVGEKQLRNCARQICNLWTKISQVPQLISLRQKFMRPQFLEVAKVRISQKNQNPQK